MSVFMNCRIFPSFPILPGFISLLLSSCLYSSENCSSTAGTLSLNSPLIFPGGLYRATKKKFPDLLCAVPIPSSLEFRQTS